MDIEYVGAIREAVGPGVRIMMDANCAYDAPATRRILLGCRDAEVHFFEEPLAPEDLEGYKALRHLTDTHLAAGRTCSGRRAFGAGSPRCPRHPPARPLLLRGFTECEDSGHRPGVEHRRRPARVGHGHRARRLPAVHGSLAPYAAVDEPGGADVEYDTSSHPFRHHLIGGGVRMSDGKVRFRKTPASA